jgi:hypothetical protein
MSYFVGLCICMLYPLFVYKFLQGGHTNTERGYLSTLASRLHNELTGDTIHTEDGHHPELQNIVTRISQEDKHPLLIVWLCVPLTINIYLDEDVTTCTVHVPWISRSNGTMSVRPESIVIFIFLARMSPVLARVQHALRFLVTSGQSLEMISM